ncbi:hypothetical protein P7M18_24265, partial [Vibrio parahaemolyticus]|nr:hypothetical protein [Vibrio parahaemolyticus]
KEVRLLEAALLFRITELSVMHSAVEIIQSRIKVLERQRDNETLPQNIMAINYALTELERGLAHIQHMEP